MEKPGYTNEEFKPAKTVEVTRKGAEAALRELKIRAEKEPDLQFARKLKEETETEVLLVGGVIRDSILGMKSGDYDLLICGAEKDVLENYLKSKGRIIETSDFGTATYKYLPHGQEAVIDLAIPRVEEYETKSRKPTRVRTKGVKIEEDLSRRDFTFNAVAMEIFSEKDKIYDFSDGIEDIRHRIVRSVGDPKERFREDPLRILRAIRFATRLDFEIEPTLFSTIREMGDSIDHLYLNDKDEEKRRVAYERIKKEVEKSMEVNPKKFIDLLEETGLLPIVFPEIASLSGIEQPKEYHSEGDALTHTKMTLENIPTDADLSVKLAALYHDAGKKETFDHDKENEEMITFYGHDKISSRLATQDLKRLRFPNSVIGDVAWLIENHMRIFSFTHMKRSKQKIMAGNPLFTGLLILARADAEASKRSDGKEDYSFFEVVGKTVSDLEKTTGGKEYVALINGQDIISLIQDSGRKFTNDKYGRLVGEIKKEINDIYNNGEIGSREEGLDLARKRIEEILIKDY